MRAAIVPALKSRWEVRDVPTPDPGPNQVLIEIHASGMCFTDVHQTNGELPGEFPRILGHEPVGRVVAVGDGVRSRRVGDRVGVPWLQASCGRCEWCLRGRPMFCPDQVGTSVNAPGGHAEYMVAYADATVLLPDAVSYEQAAPILCAGYTVWSGFRWANPRPHERVAVVGVGGLGHLAVQYAKAAGFETIAVSHSPDKDRLVRELGADEVVRDGKGLAAAGGADVVLGTSNSIDAMADTIQGLRPDGRLVVMGFEAKALPVSPADLIMRRIQVIGSQQNGREYLYEALDYVAKGKVKVIGETYTLGEVHQAFERVADGKVRFRAVVVNQR
jgi:2-desacetyl-2-hydroxyethyl bacteriochlorophyllide A dehydrogenase